MPRTLENLCSVCELQTSFCTGSVQAERATANWESQLFRFNQRSLTTPRARRNSSGNPLPGQSRYSSPGNAKSRYYPWDSCLIPFAREQRSLENLMETCIKPLCIWSTQRRCLLKELSCSCQPPWLHEHSSKLFPMQDLIGPLAFGGSDSHEESHAAVLRREPRPAKKTGINPMIPIIPIVSILISIIPILPQNTYIYMYIHPYITLIGSLEPGFSAWNPG